MDDSFDAFEIKPTSSIIEHFNNHPTCIDKEFNFILQKTELRSIEHNSDKFKSALSPKNKIKNRYSNVLPFEDTRVKITIGDDEDDDNYQNNNNNNNNNSNSNSNNNSLNTTSNINSINNNNNSHNINNNNVDSKGEKRRSIGSIGQSDVLHSDEENDSEDEEQSSDYINASYICNKTYICTQGPLLNTIVDFWKMTWEQESNIIVMLTREEENQKQKCDKYWPDKDEDRYGPYLVRFDNYIVIPDILIRREFTLVHVSSGKSRKIYHFQYTSWPDHGTPQSTTSFLRFISFVDSVNRTGPFIVHCSAGIGRSGTFCVIHSVATNFIKHYEEKKQAPSINLPKLIVDMRNERPGMVQTRDQYRFCYLAISETMLSGIKKDRKRKGLSYSYSSIPLTENLNFNPYT